MSNYTELVDMGLQPRDLLNLLDRGVHSHLERWLLNWQELSSKKKVETIAVLSLSDIPHRFLAPDEIFKIIERKNDPYDYDRIHNQTQYRERFSRAHLYNELGIDSVMRADPSFWEEGIDYNTGMQYWLRGARENHYPGLYILRETNRADSKRKFLIVRESLVTAPSSSALKKFLQVA